MKELLKKLKLIDHLQINLEIQKNDFVHKLSEQVDEGSTSFFSDVFDIFSSSKKEYKGIVDANRFKIKRKKKFFDVNMNMAVANGTYTQKENKLIITTEINGFTNMMIPFYIFCVLIYGAIFIGFLFAGNTEGSAFSVFPFITIHAAFMMGIPYFMMRKSTKSLKHELEREFFFLTRKE